MYNIFLLEGGVGGGGGGVGGRVWDFLPLPFHSYLVRKRPILNRINAVDALQFISLKFPAQYI